MTKHPIASYRAAQGLTLAGFGNLIGVHKATVSKWETGSRSITPEQALAIETATRGKLRRGRLRPDIFGTIKTTSRPAGLSTGFSDHG